MVLKRLMILQMVLLIGLPILLTSCQTNGQKEQRITDIHIYQHTPAWELALAVRDGKVKKIEEIISEDLDLLNFQDPKYGATLLLWAVGMDKYKSAETLLRLGADPNISAPGRHGETPLFVASGFSWLDRKGNTDARYVRLLLDYGADPNIHYVGSDTLGSSTIIEPGTSPLMYSISSGIEKTKMLVEAGADINHKTKSGRTAAIVALLARRHPEYAHYLIVEKQANITDPYFRRVNYEGEDPEDKFYPVDILRNWVFELDSNEYRLKMDIVREFIRQGVDYWNAEIPSRTLEHIQKLYPDSWEEYIQRY